MPGLMDSAARRYRAAACRRSCVVVLVLVASLVAACDTKAAPPNRDATPGDTATTPAANVPVAVPASSHGAYIPNTWRVIERDDGDVVQMYGCTDWDFDQLRHFDRFVRVECVDVRGAIDFEVLRTFRQCNSVSIAGWTGADGASFATLCALPWLKHLELDTVLLSPEEFEALATHDHIETLTIRNYIVNFKAMCEVVSRCASLRRLSLGYHQFLANDLLVFKGSSIKEIHLEGGAYGTTDSELADLTRQLQPIKLTWR